MSKLTFTEAFQKYGAKLKNVQWSVSSRSDSDEIVVSIWAHHLKPRDGKLRCTDRLSRWSGNIAGNNLLIQHLLEASSENLPIRLVIARTKDTDSVDHGHDASGLKKSFSARPDLVGELVSFDGDEFVIDFRKVE
jgi:hypothetical protein